MAEVVTFGESMARIASTQIGPLRHATNLHLGIAGAETNVAIGLARLGVSAKWIGRVGDDEFGRLIAFVLRGEGVETAAIVDETAPTGLLFKERRTSRVSRINYYRTHSAGSRLTPDDIDESAIAEARMLHLTGITPALSSSALEATLHALDLAERHRTPVSLDLNYRSALWDEATAGEVLRLIAARAHIVFATVDEARLMTTGSDERHLAIAIAGLGPKHVLIKRGELGALALVDGEFYEAPILPVVELDPVGAGDAFTAGYLSQWCAGASVERMLNTAARCGAFVVTVEGDWEGLPTVADLDLLGSTGHVHR